MADKKPAKKISRVAAAKAKATEKAKRAKEKRVSLTVTKEANGFVEFIRSRGIVGLAIGLAIGSVATGTVKTIVEGFITPVVQFLVGTHKNLELQTWDMELWGRTANFKWGAALSSLITLVATVFVIYLLVRLAKLDRLDKKD